MSGDDLWRVVGRARFDLDFGGRLKRDFAGAVSDAGYMLSADELSDARRAVEQSSSAARANPQPWADLPFNDMDQQKMRELRMRQLERMGKFTDDLYRMVMRTFAYASLTYRSVSLMNWLTFVTGIAMFVFSAVYATYGQEKAYALLFAGLGVSSFVGSFLLRPPEQTQKALSDLIRAEVAFMNYIDQQFFWEGYANLPHDMRPGPDPARIERASAELMNRAQQTVHLMQTSVAEPLGKAEDGPPPSVATAQPAPALDGVMAESVSDDPLLVAAPPLTRSAVRSEFETATDTAMRR